jgi:glycine/D-amino acid oxidase-like deaminating enzyme
MREKKRVTDRERFDEIVKRLAPAELEGIVRPLFARFIELARENARVAHQIAHAHEVRDAYRLELRELAHKLEIDDPCAGLPLPSEGMADRVSNALKEAALAASEEYRARTRSD